MNEIKSISTDGAALRTFKVESVAEEYDILTKLHGEPMVEFVILGQTLIFRHGRPYDKINICLKNGKEISYVFDIGSFYNNY